MSRKCPEPSKRPNLEDEPWSIKITVNDMAGPCRYIVSLTHGMMNYGPDGYGWFRWTEAGARRKGEKELRRRMRQLARQKMLHDRLAARTI